MHGMINQLVVHGTSKGRTRQFYRGRTRRELPYLAEFEQLAIDGKIMLSQANAIDFVNHIIDRFPFRIREIRTDNGHEFQARFHWQASLPRSR